MIRSAMIACLSLAAAAFAFFVWNALHESQTGVTPTVDPYSIPGGEPVSVAGSTIQFAPHAQQIINDKPVLLNITGTAVRTRYTVKVYAMASYIEAGIAINSAEELATAPHVKLLHLVMERKASGNDFIDAFRTAIGKERAKHEFAEGFAKLTSALGKATADKGENVTMLFVPGTGIRIRVGETADVTIPGDAFGQAIWETYLGKNPLDNDMKKGLVILLGK